MLEAPELQRIARSIVERRIPSVTLESIRAEPFTSSEGEAALRITLVITPETVDSITGEDALKLLVELHDDLLREGEERIPIVEYATADDVPSEET